MGNRTTGQDQKRRWLNATIERMDMIFFLFCCSVSDFRILYQILTVLRVLGNKFSLISMKNNVRRWVRVGKNGEVRWKKGALGMRKETGAA